MTINYLVSVVKPAFLQNELIHQGKKGWELVNIVVLQIIKPGLNINGAPQVEINYQLIFKQYDDNGKTNNIKDL